MKITAQEILKKEFDRKMKGYSPIEVDQFLDEIIASMEEGEKEYKAGLSALQTQVDGLISEKAALEAQIDELKAQQEEDKKNQLLLKKALAMSKKKEQDYMEKAQEKVKSLMDAAHSAADQVNREAQTKARQIVMEANESAKKTEAEVEDRGSPLPFLPWCFSRSDTILPSRQNSCILKNRQPSTLYNPSNTDNSVLSETEIFHRAWFPSRYPACAASLLLLRTPHG